MELRQRSRDRAGAVCAPMCAPSYLDLEVVADVATVEFGADQFEFPVKQSLGVPVLVTDKMQDLLIIGHGVHTWNTQERGLCQTPERVRQKQCDAVWFAVYYSMAHVSNQELLLCVGSALLWGQYR